MAKPIMLNDILHFSKEEIDNAKIALNMNEPNVGRWFDKWQNDPNPPEKKDVTFVYWSYYGKTRNFHEGNLCVGCVQTESRTQWLLVTVAKIVKVPPLDKKGYCAFEPLHEYDQFLGRVIIKLNKGNKFSRYTFRLSTFIDECEVLKVCDEPYKEDKSFSLDSISLSYKELKDTLDGLRNASLKKILECIKAVYCLTDTKTGKLYIGSATSDEKGLAQRWGNYLDSKTGGNKELIKLHEEKGEQYFVDNFNFTILEYFGMKYDDSKIRERENFWKSALDTINHGYNDI